MADPFVIAHVAFTGISVLVAVAAFVRASRRTDKGEAIKMEARLVVLEERVAAVPTHKAVHDLAISIEHLAGEVKALTARQDGIKSLVDRLETVTNRQEEHLLNTGGRQK